MATTVVPISDVSAPEVAKTVSPASYAAADVGTVVPSRGLMLVMKGDGTHAATVTIAAGQAPAKAISVGATAIVVMSIEDSTYYEQTDGLWHLTVTGSSVSGLTMWAIKN